MKVLMYTKSDCPLCEKAKAFFAKNPNIPLEQILLDTQDKRDKVYDLFDRTGSDRLMPQIVLIDDDASIHHVGGWKELSTSGIESLFNTK